MYLDAITMRSSRK